MLEMEKEVIALKAQVTTLRGESDHFEMELKLHEMLEEELEKELSEARLKNQVRSNIGYQAIDVSSIFARYVRFRSSPRRCRLMSTHWKTSTIKSMMMQQRAKRV